MAQLVEQLTLNQWVAGSSPAGCTILNPADSRPMTHADVNKENGSFELTRVRRKASGNIAKNTVL